MRNGGGNVSRPVLIDISHFFSSFAAISPSNLSLSFPFFERVADVASFDRQFRRYFNDYAQFRQTQLHDGLQCNETASRNATLQWSQTVLCGRFAASSYNAGCPSTRNQTTSLVCRSTCDDFSQSEEQFVSNSSYCTPTSELRPRNLTTVRNDTLDNDRQSCTSWTSLYSADNSTCISGVDNEANCGWGFGISDQLCSYCNSANGKSIASCCYDSRTTLAGCAALGYPAAAVIRPTSTASRGSPSSTATGAQEGNDNNEDEGTHLSGGQLAGIVVGCVLGALIFGAILAWLLFRFCCGKRNRGAGGAPGSAGESEMQSDTAGMIAGAAAAPSTSPREKPYNLSEDTTRMPSQEKYGGGGGGGSPGFGSGSAALAGAGVGAVGAGGLAAAAAGSNSSRPLSETTTSGTDGRGTTVSSVRCQYTGQEICPGDDIVAIYPYSAGLSDELDLVPESHEPLSVVRIYDDGWCLLRRPDGKEGAAPLVCCQSSKGELPAHMRMGGDSTGTTGTGTGTTTTDDEVTTNGGGNMTSSVNGAVTADEYGFTSDAASR